MLKFGGVLGVCKGGVAETLVCIHASQLDEIFGE